MNAKLHLCAFWIHTSHRYWQPQSLFPCFPRVVAISVHAQSGLSGTLFGLYRDHDARGLKEERRLEPET